jgi:hypothetical protein
MRRAAAPLAIAATLALSALGAPSSRAAELRLVTDAATPEGAADRARFELEADYAQSAQAWDTYNAIQAAKDDLSAINAILKAHYGTYEEAFARVEAGVDGVRTPIRFAPLSRLYFRAASEGLATGVAENPVVPEIHAATMASGLLAAGFHSPARERGPRLEAGLTVGSGFEKRVDAYSTDIIDATPVRSGNFFFYGADLKAEDRLALARRLDLSASAELHETVYLSQTPPASLSYGSGAQFVATRWRIDSELGARHPGGVPGRFFAQAVAGPQPLPYALLPRAWDYAHSLDPLPELGTLLGGGLGWESSWGRRGHVRATAGFYGGYVGAGATLSWGRLEASAGSWGIESSSAYQTLGQRVWQATLGLAL